MKRVITVTLFCAVALTACRTPGPAVNDSNKAIRAKNCSATGKTLKTTSKEQKAADWAAIADCKAGQKKYDDAVEAYQKSLTLHRTGTQAQDVLNKCGLVLCQLKDYTAALACFKQVATIPNPDKMQSRNMLMTSFQNMADAYIAMAQYFNAVKVWEDVAKRPEFQNVESQAKIREKILGVYDAQVSKNIRLKRFDDAQKGLDILKTRAKNERITDLEVYLYLGRAAAAAHKKNYRSAKNLYHSALNIPGSKRKITVYCELIPFYLQNNKKAEAERALNKLLALPCANVQQRYQVKSVQFAYLNKMRKYKEAVELMEETVKIKGLRPNQIATCYGQISLIYYLSLHDGKLAMEYYKKAISVPGSNWQKPYLQRKIGVYL